MLKVSFIKSKLNVKIIVIAEIIIFVMIISTVLFRTITINNSESKAEKDLIEKSILNSFNQYGYIVSTLETFYRTFEEDEMTNSDLLSVLGEENIETLGIEFASIAPNDIHQIIYPEDETNLVIGKTLTETVEAYLIGQYYSSDSEGRIFVMRSINNNVIVFAKSIVENNIEVGSVLLYVDYEIFNSKTISLFNNKIFDIALLDINNSKLSGVGDGSYYDKSFSEDGFNISLSLALSKDYTRNKQIEIISQVISIAIVGIASVSLTIYYYRKNKEFISKLNNIAYKDQITNLNNRNKLEKDVNYLIKNDIPFNLSFARLDNMKYFSNMGSSIVSKESLLIIMNIIKSNLSKEVDLYLYSDDIFVWISKDEDTKVIKNECEEILKVIEKPIKIQESFYSLAMKIGLMSYPKDGNSFMDLIKKGDYVTTDLNAEMYNSLIVYNEFYDEKSLTIFDTENLVKELNVDNFEVYVQPFVTTKTKEIIGFECLSRQFKINDLGIREIVTSLERSGRIKVFDYHVLRTAFQYLIEINIKHPDIFVSVNISPINLNHDLKYYINQLLEEFKINPHNLVIEVLESENINKNSGSIDIINSISELGIRISIDDFGTGYSSLETISKLPLNFLKVDKSYFINMKQDSFEQILLLSLVQIGEKVGYELIAEGIETQKQFEHVKKLGYHICQGFFFHKAMEFDTAIILLQQQKENKI